MKHTILIISAVNLLSCADKNYQHENLSPEAQKTESINIVRKKINDSISVINRQNIYKDLSGNHLLKFSSDDTPSLSGTSAFINIGRDLYHVTGSAQYGKNIVHINGTVKRVSEKHLNFDGEITQKINGIAIKRTKKTTFFDEGKGKFWRLQNKINSSGFTDYIDIYF